MDGTQAHARLIADAVVQADSAVLLVEPEAPPDGRIGWRLPGGELRYGEHPETCIRRVLREQCGLQPEWLVLAEVESDVADRWRLLFHYRGDADRPPAPAAGIQARFFQLEHLPPLAGGDREREVIYRVIMAQAEGGP